MPKENLPLHKWMSPLKLKGYKKGRIVRFTGALPGDSTRPNLNRTSAAKRFIFHYNPNSLNINTQLNESVDVEGFARDKFMQIPGTQTLGFSLYLNRVVDKHTNRAPRGTLHDMEVLWQVINGPTRSLPQMGRTSDFGFIQPTPLFVWFGPHNRFVGYISGLAVTHALFASDMTPTISEIQISMARTLTAAGASETATAPLDANKPDHRT